MNNTKNIPCYFYNTGGCYHKDGSEKLQSECPFLHIKIDSPMEKPQRLKPPCKYYHLRGWCKNPDCIFGHVELTAQRWNQFFTNKSYPGKFYNYYYKWDSF